MVSEEQKSLAWLSKILDILRVDCPWDRAQDIDSLRYLTIEEVYELSDAILDHDYDEMRGELGDLFMHLVFYSKIAQSEGRFTMAEVIDGICKKLISRHPHISLPDREGVMHPATVSEAPAWEKVKMKEGRKSVLEGVPRSLPALVKAIRMEEKVSGIGFKWNTADDALAKVKEEYGELQEALHEDSKDAKAHAEEEFGDLMLALVCWGDMLGINADDALAKANNKFQSRFQYVEQSAREAGKPLSDLSLEQMLTYWKEAKTKEH